MWMVRRSSTAHPRAPWRLIGSAVAHPDGHRQRPVRGDLAQQFPFDPEDLRVDPAAQPRGALGYSVEHRLEIRGRGRDDPQDLGGGGLLRVRLGLACPCLSQLAP